jgi:hypothetical protein
MGHVHIVGAYSNIKWSKYIDVYGEHNKNKH